MQDHSQQNSSKNDPISKLIFEFSKLPGIGEKTASRLSYFVLKQDASYAKALAQALLDAKGKMAFCNICFIFTDVQPCKICSNPSRDQNVICVVERVSDALSIEQSGVFRGTYHVLQGVLSPLDGIGPEELKIRELLLRVGRNSSKSQELILATNPSVEGEATALYIAKLIQPLEIRLTKLAHGIPVGGLLEYTDRQTIGKALENRMEIH